LTQTETTAKPSKESFSELLDQSFQEMTSIEGSVVSGTVISIEKDMILIDVGLKCEGRVPLREFGNNEQDTKINVGDKVEVYIERLEDINGQAILSREKARREEAWVNLEVALEKQQRVNGVIFGKVKGGFTVDLEGATAFLPGSQVDIRPIKDLGVLMGTPQPFQILKMDRRRGNIVVSRRAVLEDSRAEARTELVANLQEGQVLQGVIKNITDYGAFVDLGGVDGLLHITDMAWKRIKHPSEIVAVGDEIDFSDSNLFSEEEILAIKWAEAVTNNTAASNDDLFNQLKEKFTEKQIVEMTILCAMFNMINRINDSLDVDLEEQGEVNLIKKSLHLKSDAYGKYLEWFGKFWKRNIS